MSARFCELCTHKGEWHAENLLQVRVIRSCEHWDVLLYPSLLSQTISNDVPLLPLTAPALCPPALNVYCSYLTRTVSSKGVQTMQNQIKKFHQVYQLCVKCKWRKEPERNPNIVIIYGIKILKVYILFEKAVSPVFDDEALWIEANPHSNYVIFPIFMLLVVAN